MEEFWYGRLPRVRSHCHFLHADSLPCGIPSRVRLNGMNAICMIMRFFRNAVWFFQPQISQRMHVASNVFSFWTPVRDFLLLLMTTILVSCMDQPFQPSLPFPGNNLWRVYMRIMSKIRKHGDKEFWRKTMQWANVTLMGLFWPVSHSLGPCLVP